jgi:hypothetical protein
MRHAVVAYAREHNLIKRGNRYYEVVARSRPTKFLGWYVMRGDKRISSRCKTRGDAEETLFGWQILGLVMEGLEIRRQFKSTGKQHLRAHRIPSYLRRKGWEY